MDATVRKVFSFQIKVNSNKKIEGPLLMPLHESSLPLE